MEEYPQEVGKENPFAALRRFARSEATHDQERCDLCAEAIGPEHRHLLNLPTREVLCACRACAVLLDSPAAGAGTRRLIPTRILPLTDFVLTDQQWEALQIPVNMAYFCYHSAAQKLTAFYPSPMGSTEATLPRMAWEELVHANPILQEMESDVEALLIRRERESTEVFLVPVDACYTLVGLIRMHWKGLSGGGEVRREIDRFFTGLKSRASGAGGVYARP